MQKVANTLLSAIQELVYLIGKSPFWLVALLDLCLRLFVERSRYAHTDHRRRLLPYMAFAAQGTKRSQSSLKALS